MERREFMGAALALFCGVALPAPVIELIRVAPIVPAPFVEPDWMRAAMGKFMNDALYPPQMVVIGNPEPYKLPLAEVWRQQRPVATVKFGPRKGG